MREDRIGRHQNEQIASWHDIVIVGLDIEISQGVRNHIGIYKVCRFEVEFVLRVKLD